MNRRTKNDSNLILNNNDAAVRIWALRALVHFVPRQSLIEVLWDDEQMQYLRRNAERTETHSLNSQETLSIDNVSTQSLRKDFQALLSSYEAHSKPSKHTQRILKNIKAISGWICLNPTEEEILLFVIYLHTSPILQNITSKIGEVSLLQTYHILSVLLRRTLSQIKKALSPEGILFQSGLLRIDGSVDFSFANKFDLISSKFADTLASGDISQNIFKRILQISEPPELSIDDFSHVQNITSVLEPYMKHAMKVKKTGVNILIYGRPGTGKTQFCRALTSQLGAALYEVNSGTESSSPLDGSERLRALKSAQAFLNKSKKTMLMFDEVEDVFSNGDFLFEKSAAQSSKGWMNAILETNRVPTFWITNSISSIDPAFIRRFDMVFEIPVPPKSQRKKIIQASSEALFSEAIVEQLAQIEQLAPAIITRTTSVIKSIQKNLTPSEKESALHMMLNNTLQAQGFEGLKSAIKNQPSDIYDTSYINADLDLHKLALGIKQANSARLCLYGPPGTGKTAYGRWLADFLEKPLHIVKASDLLSKYLGETEQKIAKAFKLAESEDALLMIDEVDSFLQDRRTATSNWEATQVNEMLTQIESFEGVLVVSSNLLDNIDPAAMRRFDLKAKLDYLRPEQSMQLLRAYSTKLGFDAPTESELAQISQIKNLALGDFAAVMRQAKFNPYTHVAELINALSQEITLKEPVSHKVGFM